MAGIKSAGWKYSEQVGVTEDGVPVSIFRRRAVGYWIYCAGVGVGTDTVYGTETSRRRIAETEALWLCASGERE